MSTNPDDPGILTRIETLESQVAAIVAVNAREDAEARDLADRDEAQDAQAVTLGNLISSTQSQMLWICAACLLFGAAAGYLLTRVFG